MSNNTQPPFSIGQEVVRIGKSNYAVTQGCHYTVHDVAKCGCGEWHVYILEVLCDPDDKCTAPCCGQILENTGHGCGFAKLFAPVHPPRVNAIPELLKQPIEERLDVPKINEPILS